jgi:hypothetical protein
MRIRSSLLVAALGLLLTLGLAKPSQASLVEIKVTDSISAADASIFNNTISKIVVTYTGLSDPIMTPTFGPATAAFSSNPLGYVTPTLTSTSNSITLSFSPDVTSVSGSIVFYTMVDNSEVGSLSSTIKSHIAVTSGVTGTSTLSFSAVAVPEPTSMALLGIGMTSFLAFRRFFKRGVIA